MDTKYFSSLVWETETDKIHLNHSKGDNIALSDLLLVIYNTPRGYEGKLAYLAKHLDDPIEDQYTYWACPIDWWEVPQNNDPVVAYAKVNENEVVFDDTLTVHFLYEGKSVAMPKPYGIDPTLMEEFLLVMRNVGVTPNRIKGCYTSSFLENKGKPILNLFTTYWDDVAWAVFLETKALQPECINKSAYMITYQAVSPLYKAVWDLGLSNRVTIEYLENNSVLIRMSSSSDSVQRRITLHELTLMQEGVAQEIIKSMVTQLGRSKVVNYMERYSTKGLRLKDL